MIYNNPVALIGADRPHYLKRVLESLVGQVENREVILFLDLNPAKAGLQATQTKMAKSLIPHIKVVTRDRHFGCGNNLIDARRKMFDKKECDYAFILEDDLILSPQYLTLCENLMKWCEDNYDNVGAVQAWNECKQPDEWKEKRLDIVDVTYYNWWGYLLSRKTWDLIKDYLFEFQNKFLQIPNYRRRDHLQIYKWMRKNQSWVIPPDVGCPKSTKANQKCVAYFNKCFITGQDAATMRAFENAGIVRVSTVVNRAQYIGEIGVHKTKPIFKKMGYHKMLMFQSENDCDLTTFQCLGEIENANLDN